MIIGATGTRESVSNAQRAWVYQTFEDGVADGSIRRVHHGACTGADEFIHEAAIECGLFVEVWPPIKTNYLSAQCLYGHRLVTVHRAMPYLNRDREIVKAGTDGLIALPKQDAEPSPESWGGTWYTVNFAVRIGRPVRICYPNGRTELRVTPVM